MQENPSSTDLEHLISTLNSNTRAIGKAPNSHADDHRRMYTYNDYKQQHLPERYFKKKGEELLTDNPFALEWFIFTVFS